MDQNEFPPNSHSAKETGRDAKKRIEPVVTGEVIQRKKGLGKRMREHFTGPDSVSVLDYVINDLAIPAFKEMIADVVTGGIERKLFGSEMSRGRRRLSSSNQYGHVNYNKPAHLRQQRVEFSDRGRSRHDFGELIIESRAEAEEVLSMLFMLLEQYGSVSVSDLLELANRSAYPTDLKWGWTDLRGANVGRIRGGGGYVLNLPATEPLD